MPTSRSKQPKRPHHVADWAEARGLTQADLARELCADKSVISRWFSGATPGEVYQERLAVLFGCSRASLFRHPDEDWLIQFLENRDRDEIDRIIRTLEAAFPRKIA